MRLRSPTVTWRTSRVSLWTPISNPRADSISVRQGRHRSISVWHLHKSSTVRLSHVSLDSSRLILIELRSHFVFWGFSAKVPEEQSFLSKYWLYIAVG